MAVPQQSSLPCLNQIPVKKSRFHAARGKSAEYSPDSGAASAELCTVTPDMDPEELIDSKLHLKFKKSF